jgi:ribonucleotide monophosphatase NagD (HAD superfamily)
MSLTLRNRNITVNSSTFQGNQDDVAVLLVSLHKQLRIHKMQQVCQTFLQGQEIRIVFLNMDMMNAMWVLCQVSCVLCVTVKCML